MTPICIERISEGAGTGLAGGDAAGISAAGVSTGASSAAAPFWAISWPLGGARSVSEDGISTGDGIGGGGRVEWTCAGRPYRTAVAAFLGAVRRILALPRECQRGDNPGDGWDVVHGGTMS